MEQTARKGISPVIKLYATRVRALEAFTASDPWNGGDLPSEFSIEEYVLRRQIPAIAIRSGYDGAEHFLPESLVELWRTEKIPATRLPSLVHTLEPRLMQEDCSLTMHDHRRYRLSLLVGIILFVTLLVILRLANMPEGTARPGWLGSMTLATLLGLIGAWFGGMQMRMHRQRCRNQMQWVAGDGAGAITSQMGSWLRLYFASMAIFVLGAVVLGFVSYLAWR